MEAKTISAISVEWLEAKRRLVKISTLSLYNFLLNKHLLPAFGHLNSIDEEMVQAFVFSKIDEGLSPKSIKDSLVVLDMVVQYGARRGWTKYVKWKVDYPANSGPKKVEILTIEQQRTLVAYLRSHPSRRNLGILISLNTGLRIGEVCGLRWCDFDWEGACISVTHTVSRIYLGKGRDKSSEIQEGTPKTSNSLRLIPVTDSLLELAREIRNYAAPECYVLSGTLEPVEPRLLRDYYNKLMRRIGMPPIKYHGLRHSFATRCIESNCDYKTVSSLLGHANVSTTMNLYVHPNIEHKKRCIQQMLAMLNEI